jgi:hypothetical protein
MGIGKTLMIIQKPPYLLYAAVGAAAIFTVFFSLGMIGYCVRHQWEIVDTRAAYYDYKETNEVLKIQHTNMDLFDKQNDFVNYKSQLIHDQEDELENLNVDVQSELLQSGRDYLKYFDRAKVREKKFKLTRRERLNKLLRSINNDVCLLQIAAEEKRLHYLDLDKVNLDFD